MTKQADFKRRVRERMARTGESYTAARAQLLAQAGRRDAARDQRRLDGALACCRPRSSSASSCGATCCTRGRCPTSATRSCAPCGRASSARARRRASRQRDAALAAGRDGEYVLWFEADLYDQLQIAQILARLAALRVPAERITLICIGEYLGIAHFGGLGELRPDQLEALPAAAAVTLTADALELATRAWAALRAPDPRGLAAHRGRALARAALPARGLRPPRPRVPVDARRPLAHRAPPARRGRRGRRHGGRGVRARRGAARRARSSATRGPSRRSSGWRAARCRCSRRARASSIATPPVALTDAGRRVLDGAEDHVALNGIDRWIGGVHLVGREVPWRWDEGVEAVVAVRRRLTALRGAYSSIEGRE